jgi:TctA family transporter
MNIEPSKKRAHRVRDFILYIAISFAVVAVILFVGLSHGDHEKYKKWVFFTFYTSGVFGFVIEQSRALWKLRSFWLLTGLFLLLHCITLAVILAHMQQLKAISFVPGFVEIVVLRRSIGWLLRPTPTPR